MGKKVYNAKARQNPQTVIDNSALKDVSIPNSQRIYTTSRCNCLSSIFMATGEIRFISFGRGYLSWL